MNIKKHHKASIIIFAFLILLIIGGYWMFFARKPIVTEEDFAKLTLSWLAEERDSDGLYYIGRKYFNVDDGVYFPGNNRAGLSVLWGRYSYFRKTGNVEELEILKSDIISYMDEERIKGRQINFWNCYFMYPIWQDDIFNDAYKEKLERICFESTYETGYYLPGTVKEIEEVINAYVKETIEEEDQIFTEEIQVVKFPTTDLYEDPPEIRHLFFSASDRMTRYLWRGDEESLKVGLWDFKRSLDEYRDNQEELRPYEGCMTGIASLIYYDISENDKYLRLAEIISDQQIQRIDGESIKDVSICGLFFEKLYEKTDSLTYIERKREIIDSFIETNFNQEDGYFYYYFNEELIIETRYNGILAGILKNN